MRAFSISRVLPLIFIAALLALSHSAHAELLFHDDFSSGDKSKSNSNFRWTGGHNARVVEGVDRNGVTRPMLNFTYLAWGGSGSSDDKKWIEQRFELRQTSSSPLPPGIPEFTMSFWLRVPSNFALSNADGGSENNKLFMLWMDKYSSDGDGSTVGMEYRPLSDGAKFYTKVSKGGYLRLGRDTAETRLLTVPGDRGRWMQIGVRIVVESSPGASDGTFEVWRKWQGEAGFTKTHDVSNQAIHMPANGPQGIGYGYLLGYANNAFAEQTTFWLDDFKIGTTIESVGISLNSTSHRPMPPTLLTAD